MTYWYRPYTSEHERQLQVTWRDGEQASPLVGEVRSEKCEFPICFVHSHTTGARIVNALNAQADITSAEVTTK